jgi:hypothetical protein
MNHGGVQPTAGTTGGEAMSRMQVELTGFLRPDGTLVLDGKPDLPPGRVRVIVEHLVDIPADDPFFQTLQQIWSHRQEAGLVPRAVEDVEAQRRALRTEADNEVAEAGHLQEESRALRPEATGPRGEPP